MSEQLNGALGLEYKQRRGKDSAWVTTSGTAGNALVSFDPAATTTGNRVLPDMYMDRNRAKLRSNLDWEASEKLSFQAVAEHTQDDYLRAIPAIVPTQIVPVVAGGRTIIGDSLSPDAAYRVSDDWRVNGFWTRSYNRWNVNKASLSGDTRNTTDTLGAGVSGQATSRLTLGMDILTTGDTTTFNNQVATSSVPSPGNIPGWNGQSLPGNYLPNIHYNTEKLNLFAKYDIEKNTEVQVNLGYQHFKTDDWQWGYNGVPFLYSDNTTVSQPMQQHLKFVAARYIYKF